MSEKKLQHSASIGFWLVLGTSQKTPLLVCPALVRNKAVEKIEELSIQEVWNVSVQAPEETNKGAIMVMIPEIINISNLDKPIEEFANLWEIKSVKDKCESLTKQYIIQLKENNKRNI